MSTQQQEPSNGQKYFGISSASKAVSYEEALPSALPPIGAYQKLDPEALVRAFDSGATRSADTGRYDPEGFLSPIVIERYCEYMNKTRVQPDGSVRDSDNWQKGIPITAYMKGLFRHFMHLWTRHRGWVVQDPMASVNIEEDCCAILFNVSGYLHETLRIKESLQVDYPRALNPKSPKPVGPDNVKFGPGIAQ